MSPSNSSSFGHCAIGVAMVTVKLQNVCFSFWSESFDDHVRRMYIIRTVGIHFANKRESYCFMFKVL